MVPQKHVCKYGAISVIRSDKGILLDQEKSQIEFFSPKLPIFLHACAAYSELSSDKSTVISVSSNNEDYCCKKPKKNTLFSPLIGQNDFFSQNFELKI